MDYRGIEARGDSIRIAFQWQGQRCRETLKLPPTKKNMAYAAGLRAEILRKIALGSFQYSEFFPDSPRAGKAESPTFLTLARQWMDGQTHLAYATAKEYRAMLNRYWVPRLGGMEIRAITHGLLLEVIASHNWSGKTRNNALGPLKAIFDMAHQDGHIDTNPAGRLRNAKVQKPEPDPLTLDEVNTVLKWMEREPVWHAYFELAFFTGLRTSELIALEWGDLDLTSQTIRVQRARVRGKIKGTKTGQVRDVELSSRALAALQKQKPRTFLAGGPIFLHPATGEPIVDDRPPRLAWTSALKAAGLRHRDAYQTRHTCISLWLMAGANPMWVARQAGHSSPQMTFQRYGRWIARADAGMEMAKIEQKLAGNGLG